MTRRYVTHAEVVARTGLSKTAAYDLMGELGAIHFGRARRLREDKLNAYLDQSDPGMVPRSFRGTGCVYFIAAPEVHRIKIGYTDTRPDDRLKWATMSPVDLEVVGTIEGVTHSLEQALHQFYRELRVRREWFDAAGTAVGALAVHVAMGNAAAVKEALTQACAQYKPRRSRK